MSRILLLLSIILLLATAFFVYQQGIFSQVFNPTVIVVQAKENIRVDARVRVTDVDLVERPIAELAPSTLVFPRDVVMDSVNSFLRDGRATLDIPGGEVLTGLNFSKAPQFFQVRIMSTMGIGDPIESNMLEVVESDLPLPNTLVFTSRIEADRFVEGRTAMRAARAIDAGTTMGVDDFSSGDGGAIYVLETIRPLSQGNVVTAADVRAAILPSTEIPRGAIAFPSRAGADIFITASNSLSIALDLGAGTVLTAEMLRPGSTRVLRDMAEDVDPETFDELVQLQALNPLEVKFINLLVDIPDLDVRASLPLIGSAPRTGMKMDMWVETDSTTGAFGTIRLRRFVKDIEMQQVVDPDLVLSERERRQEVAANEQSGATPPPADDTTMAAKGIFYWANVTRSGGLAFEEARDEERIAFLLASDTPIADFLGNGVTCREDLCTISRSSSEDLQAVRNALLRADGQEAEVAEEQIRLAPFSVMDGVSVELEERMHAEGYLTFADVALWEDAQIGVIEFQLGITRNLAIYIRQQARTIVNMPSAARSELGITGAPEQ